MNHLRSPLAKYLIPLTYGVVLFYFLFHTIQGDRGILAWMRVVGEIAKAERTLADLERERALMEKQVSMLRPDHLDPDLLDERARDMLGFANADEWVVELPALTASVTHQPSAVSTTDNQR